MSSCSALIEDLRFSAGFVRVLHNRQRLRTLLLMAEVTLYTKPMCPHCFRARQRLRRRGATIREIRSTGNVQVARSQLRDRFGADTFPQIVIGERHIGGAEDLVRLDKSGELARLLAGRRSPSRTERSSQECSGSTFPPIG